MARTSAALLVTAVLAASAVHLVHAGIRSSTGLQYPGITGVIPACVCCHPGTCPDHVASHTRSCHNLLLHCRSLIVAVAC